MLGLRTVSTLPHGFIGRLALVAFVCVSVVALATCSTGGRDGPTMSIIPDQPNTLPAATTAPPIAVSPVASVSQSGQFESPEDTDFFRVQVPEPGTLTLSTSGADTILRAFDKDGIELPAVPGSLIVTVSQAVIDKGGEVFVEIAPRDPAPSAPSAASYELMISFERGTPGTQTPTAETMSG